MTNFWDEISDNSVKNQNYTDRWNEKWRYTKKASSKNYGRTHPALSELGNMWKGDPPPPFSVANPFL